MVKKRKYTILSSAILSASLFLGSAGASASTETDKILEYYNGYSNHVKQPVPTSPVTPSPSTTNPVLVVPENIKTSDINIDDFKESLQTSDSLEEMLQKLLYALTDAKVDRFDGIESVGSIGTTANTQTVEPIISMPESTTAGYKPTVTSNPSVNVIHGPSSTGSANIILGEVYTKTITSNNDTERRESLQELYNIELTDDIKWSGSDQSGTERAPDGDYYTSTENLKRDNIYASNASRNELIDYAIKKNNWQPYYWSEAMQTPAYFEYVNGELKYNKNYYAWLFNSLHGIYTEQLSKGMITQDVFNRFVKEYVDKYNNAPGYAVHATNLNHNDAVRLQTGAQAFNPNFFESIWNDQDVINKGKFKNGYNPIAEIKSSLTKK